MGRPSSSGVGISATDYAERKAFLEFGDRDAELIRRIGPALAAARSRFGGPVL